MKQLFENLPPIEKVTSETEYATMLSACANSGAKFAEDFLGLSVFDYNKPYLDCLDRFQVYRSGRQCGKTRNAAIKAIHFGYFSPLRASNLDEGETNVVIASITKDQARLIFSKIANYIHKSPTLSKLIIRETKIDLQMKWFDNSGVVNFVVRPIGDKGDSLRGYTTHMAILDEAAYIPQPVFDAFLPSTATTKPTILFTSTPRGKSGAFFNACMESNIIYEKGVPRILSKDAIKNKWTQFHVTTFDNPLTKDDPYIMELIKSTSKAAERQELYGEFLDVGTSIIPYNLLQESLSNVIKRPKFEYYDLGIDTSGKGKDETVLTTAGVTPEGLLCPVDVYVELTTDQTKLASVVAKLNRAYKYRQIYYDQTGIGDTLGDIMKERFPLLPIHGLEFTADKTDLYVNIERLFEERLINLSLLEEHHRDKMAKQLSYMYWDYGKFHDQKPKARSEHPDDYSDSCALVAYGQQSRT